MPRVTSPSGDRLFTLSQLAAHWGWSVAKLSKLVKQKAIPHLRLGRQHHDIHFRESEVEAWLRAKNVPMAQTEAEVIIAQMDRAEECRRLGIPVDHEFS